MPTFEELKKKSHVKNHPLFEKFDQRISIMRENLTKVSEKVDLQDIFSKVKQVGMKSGVRDLNAYIQEAAIAAQEVVNVLDWPLVPKIEFRQARKLKYAKHDESQLVSGELLFNLRFATVSGVLLNATVSVPVNGGAVIPPSTMTFEDRMYVLGQGAINEIVRRNSSYQLQPLRGQYAPPLKGEELDIAAMRRNEVGYLPREVALDGGYNRRTYRRKEKKVGYIDEKIELPVKAIIVGSDSPQSYDAYTGVDQGQVLRSYPPKVYKVGPSERLIGHSNGYETSIEPYLQGDEIPESIAQPGFRNEGWENFKECVEAAIEYWESQESSKISRRKEEQLFPMMDQKHVGVPYEIGDLIQYEISPGEFTTAIVTQRHGDLGGGKPGFSGIDPATGMETSGWEESIVEVVEKGKGRQQVAQVNSDISRPPTDEESPEVTPTNLLYPNTKTPIEAEDKVRFNGSDGPIRGKIVEVDPDNNSLIVHSKGMEYRVQVDDIEPLPGTFKKMWAKKGQATFSNQQTQAAYEAIIDNPTKWQTMVRYAQAWKTTGHPISDLASTMSADLPSQGLLPDMSQVNWEEIAQAIVTEIEGGQSATAKKMWAKKQAQIKDYYKVPEMFLEGLETYRHKDWGDITIGGDRGDVWIESAYMEDNGVLLSNVRLYTTHENLSQDDVREYIEDIIYFSYESIGGETFTGKTRWSRVLKQAQETRVLSPEQGGRPEMATDPTMIQQTDIYSPAEQTQSRPQPANATEDMYNQVLQQPEILNYIAASLQPPTLEEQASMVYDAVHPLSMQIYPDGEINWHQLTQDLITYVGQSGMQTVNGRKLAARIIAVHLTVASGSRGRIHKKEQYKMGKKAQSFDPFDPTSEREFALKRFTPPGYDLVLGDMVQAEEEGLDTFPRSYAHVEKNYILKRLGTCSSHHWMIHLTNDGFIINPYGSNRGRMRPGTERIGSRKEGAYVIKRNEDGKYVARPGSFHSYTTDRSQAAEYASIEEAQRGCCSNESIFSSYGETFVGGGVIEDTEEDTVDDREGRKGSLRPFDRRGAQVDHEKFVETLIDILLEDGPQSYLDITYSEVSEYLNNEVLDEISQRGGSPDDDFDKVLEDLVREMDASEFLRIPGVWEVLSEELNNEVLRRAEGRKE